MQAKTKLPKPYVNAGDTVVIDLGALGSFGSSRPPAAAVILAIRQRYAKINDGSTLQEPIVHYRELSTGHEHWVSMHFVTSVIERSNTPAKPKNIFNNRWAGSIWRESRSVLLGSVVDLVEHSLAGLNTEFTRPLDPEKVHALFNKQRPGYLGTYGAYGDIRVHEKPFKAWARRNAPKMLKTVKTLVAEGTEREQEYADELWRMIAADEETFF